MPVPNVTRLSAVTPVIPTNTTPVAPSPVATATCTDSVCPLASAPSAATTTPLDAPTGEPVRRVAATITGIEGRSVEILPNGALRVAGTVDQPLIESAAVVAMAQLEAADNPFAAVDDVELLAKVVETHRRLYDQVNDKQLLGQATEYAQRHARANLLAVGRLAAERIAELDSHQIGLLAQGLVEWAESEPHFAVRRFNLYRLLKSAFRDQESVKAAEAGVFPAAPPYEKWAEDGVLRIKAYCDDDGRSWRSQVWEFQHSHDMEVVSGSVNDPSKPMVFRSEFGTGIGAIEVELSPAPTEDNPPSLFEHIDREDIDVILYTGHAGYGQRVEAALRSGAKSDGDGKLIMLFQCWGEGGLDSIGRAFPKAQVFSTIDGISGWTCNSVLKEVMPGLQRSETWSEIMAKIDVHGGPHVSGYNQLMFSPATRAVIERHLDNDKDGKAAIMDRVYLEPTANLLTCAPTGFNPVHNAMPAYALDSAAAVQAINDVSLSLRYNKLGLEPTAAGAEQSLELGPELLVNGGFFRPEPGDHRAFSFEQVAIDGKQHVRVRQSTHFAHVQEEELKNFLAFELGQTLAEWSGKSELEAAGYGMALYVQGIFHHYAGWEYHRGALENESVEHHLFLRRYGLPEMALDELKHMVQSSSHEFSESDIGAFVEKIGAWAGTSEIAPRPLGQALALASRDPVVVDGSSFGARLDPDRLQRFVRAHPGYEDAQVVSVSPKESFSHQPRLIQVERDGQRSLLTLELHRNTQRPVALYDLGDAVDLRQIVLETIANKAELWAPPVLGAAGDERVGELVAVIAAIFDDDGAPVDAARAVEARLEEWGIDDMRVSTVFFGVDTVLANAFGDQAVADMKAYIASLTD